MDQKDIPAAILLFLDGPGPFLGASAGGGQAPFRDLFAEIPSLSVPAQFFEIWGVFRAFDTFGKWGSWVDSDH